MTKKHISNYLKVWPVAVILFFIFSCEKKQETVKVAQVNDLTISLEAFRDACRFNPHLSQISNPDLARQRMLFTMIGEKLIADAGYARDLNENDYIKAQSARFEREAMIEKLWRDKILSQISVSEQELKSAYFAAQKSYAVRYLLFEDEAQAAQSYRQLDEGLSFAALARMHGYSENTIPADTIDFESNLPNIERTLQDMQPNEISAPVKEGRFWFILKLTGKQEKFSSRQDFENEKRKLRKMLRKRKATQQFTAYVDKNLAGQTFNLDRETFTHVVKTLDARLFEKGLTPNKENEARFELMIEDQQLLDKPVARFSDGTVWSVRQLLQRLAVSPYPVNIQDRGALRMNMISATRHILDDELLVRHCFDLGLDETAYVRQQKSMWQDYLIYKKQLKDLLKPDRNAGTKNEKAAIESLEDFLIEKTKEADIKIYSTVLDTMTVNKTDMVVLKTHFPNRTVAPVHQPLGYMPEWEKHILKAVESR